MRWEKWLDVPPVWLALFVGLTWIQATRLPLGSVDHPFLDLMAGLLVGGAVLLMLVALVQLRQNRTTFLPHGRARVLVTNGVFARSRNPIYLADAMLLLGLILHWNAWPSLILVPMFMWVITDRFILCEENRLERDFPMDWARWSQTTRRWL